MLMDIPTSGSGTSTKLACGDFIAIRVWFCNSQKHKQVEKLKRERQINYRYQS